MSVLGEPSFLIPMEGSNRRIHLPLGSIVFVIEDQPTTEGGEVGATIITNALRENMREISLLGEAASRFLEAYNNVTLSADSDPFTAFEPDEGAMFNREEIEELLRRNFDRDVDDTPPSLSRYQGEDTPTTTRRSPGADC